MMNMMMMMFSLADHPGNWLLSVQSSSPALRASNNTNMSFIFQHHTCQISPSSNEIWDKILTFSLERFSLLWQKIKKENFNVDWRCCELNETFKKFDEYLNWAVLLMLSANTPHLIFDHQHFFIFKTNSCNFFFLFRFNCSPDTTSFTWFKDNSKLKMRN